MSFTSIAEKSPVLSPWQCKQAAMLYHFASLEYLKGLHRMVSDAINGFIDPLLSLAQQQNRDSVLVDPRWGTRNTAANWANNAWPFLKEFQASLAKDIAGRAFERYATSGANDCFRGVAEYSTQWATVQEEQHFEEVVRVISDYAHYLDITCDDYQGSRWTDSGFAHALPKYAQQHPMIPRFLVRTDVTGESGKTPGRTGVYVSQDDPNAALQFAWTGNGGGRLRTSKTFNEIGLAALRKIGRKDLWFNDQKMFEFAMASPWIDIFRPTIYMLGEEHRDFASLAISQNAFVDRPCKWYFVEIVNGEFEDIVENSSELPTPVSVEKVKGGEHCRVTGFYFTPAQPDSRRRLIQGEKVPELDSQYGMTIWQWDPNQLDN
jgi:hypothetical protein